jgi:hypothetical protein
MLPLFIQLVDINETVNHGTARCCYKGMVLYTASKENQLANSERAYKTSRLV